MLQVFAGRVVRRGIGSHMMRHDRFMRMRKVGRLQHALMRVRGNLLSSAVMIRAARLQYHGGSGLQGQGDRNQEQQSDFQGSSHA